MLYFIRIFWTKDNRKPYLETTMDVNLNQSNGQVRTKKTSGNNGDKWKT